MAAKEFWLIRRREAIPDASHGNDSREVLLHMLYDCAAGDWVCDRQVTEAWVRDDRLPRRSDFAAVPEPLLARERERIRAAIEHWYA